MKLGGWVIMLTTMIMILSLIGVSTTLSPIIEAVGIYITDGDVQTADMESSSLWAELFASASGLLVTLGAASIVTIGLYAATKDLASLIP